MVKIKSRTFVRIANSQGFFVPVEHTDDRVTNGLVLGQKYDLEITEATNDDN